MKTYELIIERRRPSCGGQDPREVKMLTVTTDDPVAYVRSIEKEGELQVETNRAGETVITLDQGLRHISYTFAED